MKHNHFSSVLIAVKLLDDIKKINSKFGKIQDAGWQDFFYVRGATGGKTTMNNIDILFKYANKNDKKFGDINKWSPADIYFVSKNAKSCIICPRPSSSAWIHPTMAGSFLL